jgi:hypothetical protein
MDKKRGDILGQRSPGLGCFSDGPEESIRFLVDFFMVGSMEEKK